MREKGSKKTKNRAGRETKNGKADNAEYGKDKSHASDLWRECRQILMKQANARRVI